MGFVKLSVHNDWEFLWYSLEGDERPRHEAELKFEIGAPMRARFPDGFIVEGVVGTIRRDASAGDHGNISRATQDLPCFEFEYHGIKNTVYLDHVEIEAST